MDSSHKYFALDQELRVSINLVTTGLRELNRDGAAGDFFHLPILLISTGIERFLKVIICLHGLKTTGEIAEDDKLHQKNKGAPTTNLRRLLSQITTKYFSDDYLQKTPAAQSDIQMLRTDERIHKLIEILSDFSMGATYYNMNIIAGMEPPGACQEDEWEKLRMEILEEDPDWLDRVQDMEENKAVGEEICSRITVSCEIFMRSLSSLFTNGKLGDVGDELSEYLHHFLFLTDGNLGDTDYSIADPVKL